MEIFNQTVFRVKGIQATFVTYAVHAYVYVVAFYKQINVPTNSGPWCTEKNLPCQLLISFLILLCITCTACKAKRQIL